MIHLIYLSIIYLLMGFFVLFVEKQFACEKIRVKSWPIIILLWPVGIVCYILDEIYRYRQYKKNIK